MFLHRTINQSAIKIGRTDTRICWQLTALNGVPGTQKLGGNGLCRVRALDVVPFTLTTTDDVPGWGVAFT